MSLNLTDKAALKSQEILMFREEHDPVVRNRIRRVEFIVHPGWGTLPSKSSKLKQRVDYISDMDQDRLDETFFVMVLGGFPPHLRRREVHCMYKAFVSNSLDDYLADHTDSWKSLLVNYLKKLNPQSFQEFEFLLLNKVNVIPSDVSDLQTEIKLSEAIRSRTRQVLEFSACMDSEDLIVDGGPVSEDFRDTYGLEGQGALFAKCFGENMQFFSSKLDINYWGDYGNLCVRGVRLCMDGFFDQLGKCGLRYRSKILSELCVFKESK